MLTMPAEPALIDESRNEQPAEYEPTNDDIADIAVPDSEQSILQPESAAIEPAATDGGVAAPAITSSPPGVRRSG